MSLNTSPCLRHTDYNNLKPEGKCFLFPLAFIIPVSLYKKNCHRFRITSLDRHPFALSRDINQLSRDKLLQYYPIKIFPGLVGHMTIFAVLITFHDFKHNLIHIIVKVF